jgi:hypothetical protein
MNNILSKANGQNVNKKWRALLIFVGGGSLLFFIIGIDWQILAVVNVITFAFVVIGLTDHIFKTSFLLLSVIFSSAISITYWLDNRIMIGGFPLSIPDIVIIIYGFYGIIYWSRTGASRFDKFGFLLIAWFVYCSFVGLIVGIDMGNPLYAILQEYRVVLYTVIGYFSTLAIFNPDKHLKIIILGFILAGMIVCVWQLSITIFGTYLGEGDILNISADGISRSLRDVNLPLYFASYALIFLGITYLEAPECLGLMKKFVLPLMLIFITVPLLSMTRTIWVSEAISAVMLIIYYFRYYVRRKKTQRVFYLIAIVLVCLGIVTVIFSELLPSVYNSLIIVWNLSFSANNIDTTYNDRFYAPLVLISYLWENGFLFWVGMGFGNMQSGANVYGPFTSLHNVYLCYMVYSGFIGFLLYLVVWFTPLIVSIRLLIENFSPIKKAYLYGSAMNMTILSILIYTMPPHWAESALVGVSFAIVTILSSDKNKQVDI